MNLPIDVVPGSSPPKFRWRQLVNTMDGKRWIENEGVMPPSAEDAIATLVAIAKQLQAENEALRKQVEGMAHRVAAQSELLSKSAEKKDTPTLTKRVKNG